MTLKNTVESLTQTAVSTAFTAVRHPFGTAARATGLVRDTVGAGIGLVRGGVDEVLTQAPAPAAETIKDVQETVANVVTEVVTEVKDTAVDVKAKSAETSARAVAEVQKAPADENTDAKTSATDEADEDPRDNIPGPDLARFEPPAPEDLPEPIVIEAEPAT